MILEGKLAAALPLVIASLLLGTRPAHGEATFDWDRGLRAEFGEAELRAGGRLHADIVRFDDDLTKLDDAEDFRRARLTSRVDYRDLRFRADYDFGISDGWKSLYVQYRAVRRLRLTAGNHTAPFSLEDNESSNDLALLERSTASALIPGLLSGISLRRWGDDWSIAGGLFGDEYSDLSRRGAPGMGLIGRVTWSPLRNESSILHLGLALERRNIDDGEAVRLRARPYSRLADARLVDTGSIPGADRLTSEGYELAWADGNRRLQGEWYRSRVDAAGADPEFSGYYLLATISFDTTDYRYSRSRGVFRGIEPTTARGGFELGLRYSALDLTDDGVAGGKQVERSFGLTWVRSRQMRVLFNYALIDAEPNRNGDDESVDVLGLRLLLRL